MGTSGTGSGGTDFCNEYPYTISNSPTYGEPRTIITLDMLGGDATFQGIFTGSLTAILQGCRSKIDEVLVRAQTCLGGTLPTAAQLRTAIDDVNALLAPQTTMQTLMESSQASWPAGLRNSINDLYAAGFYINCQMIPDSDKPDVVSYFSAHGDNFFAKTGSLELQDYFELPRNVFSQALLDLLDKGRRLGVLLCHEAAIATDSSKSGYCWNGSNCVATSLNKACNGDSASSDLC